MEQRPLRLGDIVDDYCPRERRVTNHAVVAIVEDAIRQTRCTTCDTEHVFKGPHEPRRRLRPVLARPEGAVAAVASAESIAPRVAVAAEPPPALSSNGVDESSGAASMERDTPEPADSVVIETWTHRRLIRATLPKTEGEVPPPRPIPEFTMHQRPTGRPARSFRPDQHGHGRGAENGHFRGRQFSNGNGNGSGSANGRGANDSDDEINGNVAGPPSGRSHNGPNGHAGGQQPGGGRRRRGRRRRGR